MEKHLMKIRGLLAGLLVAAALSGCTSSATAPEKIPSAPAAFNETPPPDTTNRGGGGMGSGN
ncbi:MAG TPA: hypothetical protein VEQ60_22545 [Longimicrobium sp.]|nr:hypothetical protein [Longimicrobium sp.]